MKNLVTVLLIIFFAAGSAFSQDEKNLKKKLKEVEGKAEKITIKTDEGEYTFEGDDAEKLLSRMKKRSNHFSFNTPGVHLDHPGFNDDSLSFFIEKHLNDSVFVSMKKMHKNFPKPDKNHFKFRIFEDKDEFEVFGEGEKNYKKVIVEDEDGEKVVTITTSKDGEEETEVLKGKEAEEYLENQNHFDFEDEDETETKIIIKKKQKVDKED